MISCFDDNMNFIYQNIFINYSRWSRNAISKCILLDYECGSFYGEVTQLIAPVKKDYTPVQLKH
jgi:hypothetical protein